MPRAEPDIVTVGRASRGIVENRLNHGNEGMDARMNT